MKHFYLFFILGFVAISTEAQTLEQSVLVCKGLSCAPVNKTMTSGFLHNKFVAFFEKNLGKNILLCEADAATHSCINAGITIPVVAGVSYAEVSLPSAKLLNAKLLKGGLGLDIIFDYNFFINGMRTACYSSLSKLDIQFTDKVQMFSPDIDCKFTSLGSSLVNISYNIDYIDFDFGVMGAYYTLGISEKTKGDKTGYMLLQFNQKLDSSDIDLNAEFNDEHQNALKSQEKGVLNLPDNDPSVYVVPKVEDPLFMAK